MNQLDLVQWAEDRPSAKVIDIMSAVIKAYVCSLIPSHEKTANAYRCSQGGRWHEFDGCCARSRRWHWLLRC